MKTLTRDDILNADDLKRVAIDVPEWGGQLYIRTLKAREREHFEKRFIGNGKPINNLNLRAELAAMSVVDEEGTQLFRPADIEKLAEKAAPAMERIFSSSLRLNGFTQADVEELEGN